MSDCVGALDRPPKLLYISDRIGGESRDNSDVMAAIDALFRMVDEACPPPGPEDLRIDLTFDVSGPLFAFDYEGVRTGRFVPTKRLLVVQAAVPIDLKAQEAPQFFQEVLSRTVDLARQFVEPRKLSVSTNAVEQAVSALIERLKA